MDLKLHYTFLSKYVKCEFFHMCGNADGPSENRNQEVILL